RREGARRSDRREGRLAATRGRRCDNGRLHDSGRCQTGVGRSVVRMGSKGARSRDDISEESPMSDAHLPSNLEVSAYTAAEWMSVGLIDKLVPLADYERLRAAIE